MKKILLPVVFILFGIYSFSAKVERDKALIVALNWMNIVGEGVYDFKDIGAVYAEMKDRLPVYYIITFKTPGWVIVSGSDLAEPVVGYSTSSLFQPDSMPAHVKGWMDGIATEVNSAEKYSIVPSSEIKNKWNEYGDHIMASKGLTVKQSSQVGPLLSTTWDQGQFYNEMCPADPLCLAGHGHVWVGCVATSMAQVMKYWGYPGNGMGYHSYVHPKYGTLYADFENTTYNWAAMPNNVNSQNIEVQRISYHAAVAVEMDFAPDGSGAYLNDANNGLINYFRYNNTIFEASKSDWDTNEWMAQLRRDLDAGRPVIYSGYNFSYTSGHAWVCDGYAPSNYFHFNWGWSGSYNGYYLLSSLNPGTSNFSNDQSALFSIEPVLPSSIPIPYNQGFELGNESMSLMGVAEITTEQFHTGSQSLRLGRQSIVAHATDATSLCFVVPTDAELNFWVKRKTLDISTNNQQIALLMPQYGTTPLLEIYNGDFNDADWVSYNVNLSAYTGQIVRLIFIQQDNDLTRQQWMYVDDISITGISNNLAPYVPSSPIPSNLEDNVDLSPTLRWNGGDPNGDDVIYYIYFGTQSNPSLIDSTFDNYYRLPNLTHTTAYHWKINANDGLLTTSSPDWFFTTMGIPPLVGNCGISNVTSNSASICGEIIDDNGTKISSRGICWTQTSLPSLSTEHMEAADTLAVFICDIQNLLPYTVYNFNAYANSDKGLGYSPVLSLRTLSDFPEISITEVNSILRSSATVTGRINRINDASVLRRGAVWSQTEGFDPLSGQRLSEEGNWQNPEEFQINLFGLPGPGRFFVRLFAENSAGITYSDQIMFQAPNLAPFIDLDANNSKGAGESDYLGISTEQLPGGVICDADVIINDRDGDEISRISINLENPVDSVHETLSLVLPFDGLIVSGDGTTHIELASSIPFSYTRWQEVLTEIEYINQLNSPYAERVRHISIKVFDGIDWSNTAVANINIIQVNDPPVIQRPPTISTEPVYGRPVTVVPGSWIDSLDNCSCTFSYHYKWQAKDNEGNIEDVETENQLSLSLNQNLCDKSIRVVEEVTDRNCGGATTVFNSAASEWFLVGRTPQTITLDPIPLHYFHERFFKLNGHSTSGLPILFSVSENNTLAVSNDTAYMLNTGTVVVSGMQPGNECYLPSEVLYKIAVVARGNQEIHFESPLESKYSEQRMALPAEATSRLDLVVISSDSSIAYSTSDSIIFTGIGEVNLAISQPGNQNYLAAAPVVVVLTVLKGDQAIISDPIQDLYYGQEPVPIIAYSSSSLDVDIASSDLSIVEVLGNLLKVNGVGNALITISQQGNNLWNPANVIEVPITIRKGIQDIIVEDIQTKRFTDQPFFPICHATSGLQVSFSINDTSIADVLNGNIVIKKAGETTVHFYQEGNSLWEPAMKDITLQILKADQAILFHEIEPKVFGDNEITLDAIASSGLPVNYNISDPEVASIAMNMLVIINAGTTTITALQPGNEQWNGAEPVSVTLTVGKKVQTITVNLPDSVLLSEQYLVANIETSSGLPVTIHSLDENLISVRGDTLMLLAPGEVFLSFDQQGNRNFMPVNYEDHLIIYQPVSSPAIDEPNLLIYPNPSTGILNILLSGNYNLPGTICITNVTGETILQQNLSGLRQSINLSGFPQGIYFIHLVTTKQSTIHKILLTAAN